MARDNLQPEAVDALPTSPSTQPSPATITAPGPASASAPVVGCTGTRGGTCADCGEYAAVLVPSLGGRWDYCRACADREIAEEAPAATEEDGDDRAYLYRDPDEELDELRDRRKEAQG